LKALDDPTTHSVTALDALINTSFVHHIDAASLSLIMPILDRALHDPSTDVKVKAAQIVGNMCSLAEQSDLSPYLSDMIEQLKVLLLDPIPMTRATAARALGSLLRGMADNSSKLVHELIVWFLRTIKTATLSEVERSGAAQGLAEVIAAMESLDTQPNFPAALESLNLELEIEEKEENDYDEDPEQTTPSSHLIERGDNSDNKKRHSKATHPSQTQTFLSLFCFHFIIYCPP
jgi:hypothetical protein